MKTIKKGKEIRRVRDKAALNMTTKEGWKYCPKSEYKNKVVPVGVEPEEKRNEND